MLHFAATTHPAAASEDSSNALDTDPTLSYLLDRRFSLPNATAFPNSTTSQLIPSQQQQQQQAFLKPLSSSTHSNMSRRMSLPASNFLYQQPSFADMLHGPSPLGNNTSNTASLMESFETFHQTSASLMMMLQNEDPNITLGSINTTSQFSTPASSHPSTPVCSFESAFNELLFESGQPPLPPISVTNVRGRSMSLSAFEHARQRFFVPQTEFAFKQPQQPLFDARSSNSFLEHQKGLAKYAQFAFPAPAPTAPALVPATIAEAESPTLEGVPHALFSFSNEPRSNPTSPESPMTHMQPQNSLTPTVLDLMKQGETGAKAQKFKPTEAQLSTLVGVFEKNPFPSAALRSHLAEVLQIQPKQVRFWFQNRRATYKINGVYVIKPKKASARKSSDACETPAPEHASVGEHEPDLAPVSSENPYFFVERARRNSLPNLTI
ncbi:hypothetical protein CcCBS67573_g08385 [Chytriomyces confervae]|uniref:Homeobox domain-containing protein n=1 Tax=Chytriomyces confervae TaxID=246404 RepID=A0A507EMP8_9FUNG|nr:hypothetical protein CcCBS67573_g08385 [Chytriomyces confervae]